MEGEAKEDLRWFEGEVRSSLVTLGFALHRGREASVVVLTVDYGRG